MHPMTDARKYQHIFNIRSTAKTPQLAGKAEVGFLPPGHWHSDPNVKSVCIRINFTGRRHWKVTAQSVALPSDVVWPQDHCACFLYCQEWRLLLALSFSVQPGWPHLNTFHYRQGKWVAGTAEPGKSMGASWHCSGTNWGPSEKSGWVWGRLRLLHGVDFQRRLNVSVGGFYIGSILPSASTPHPLTFSLLSNWQQEPGKT